MWVAERRMNEICLKSSFTELTSIVYTSSLWDSKNHIVAFPILSCSHVAFAYLSFSAACDMTYVVASSFFQSNLF